MNDEEARAFLLEQFPQGEDLCEELIPYLRTVEWPDGPVRQIHHPLIIEIMYHEALAGRCNLVFRNKKEALIEAEAKRNWSSFIWIHERPYRADAFAAIRNRLSDEVYWELLSDLWLDTENPFEWADLIPLFFNADRSGREENLMQEGERKALVELPDTITIHRGFKLNKMGWSWTLDRDKAEWFARRLIRRGEVPYIAHGKVAKEHVIALFQTRNEEEILVDPANVRIYRTTRLKDKV